MDRTDLPQLADKFYIVLMVFLIAQYWVSNDLKSWRLADVVTFAWTSRLALNGSSAATGSTSPIPFRHSAGDDCVLGDRCNSGA